MVIVIKTIWQTDEPYKCLSEELSFSFKHGEAEIYRTVKRFTRYLRLSYNQKTNLFVILWDDYSIKDKMDINRNF